MENIDQQIEQIEVSMEAAKARVDMAKALDELHRNRNFKKVILEGYFEKEAQRLVMLKSDPQMSDAEHQKAVDEAIIGVGQLGQYFRTVFQLASMAERALAEDEQTREELLSEAA
jgi:hypothetical protein